MVKLEWSQERESVDNVYSSWLQGFQLPIFFTPCYFPQYCTFFPLWLRDFG